MNPEDVTFTFDSDEAKGTVVFNDGAYGPGFTVTAPDGTVYTGFLDLFHFTRQGDGYFQVILDTPNEAQGETFHARIYPSGRIETFSE